MIVDLVRNDLGRLARFGTVKVKRLFDIERFETVWQMTSTVLAETRPGVRLFDIFAAMFPCGSVTGAPKARTMEIVASLETSPRGIYCGAIGLLAPPGVGKAPRPVLGGHPDSRDRRRRWFGRVRGGRGSGPRVGRRRRVPGGDGQGAGVEHPEGAGDPARDDALGAGNGSLAAPAPSGQAPVVGTVLRCSRTGGRDREPSGWIGAASTRCGCVSLVPEAGRPSLEVFPLAAGSPVVGLAVDTEPVDRSGVFRYHKTTRRRAYQEAAARHPGADDVVLVNDLGEVVETTIANLAVRIGGEWLTPPIEAGCLPGTYREELVDLGVLRECRVAVADLIETDELAVINSVRGWRPAKLLG